MVTIYLEFVVFIANRILEVRFLKYSPVLFLNISTCQPLNARNKMYDEIKVAVLQGVEIFMMWTNKNLYNISECWCWACIKALKMEISEEWKEICAPIQIYTNKEHMPLSTQDLTLSEIKGGRVNLQSWLLILKWCCWAGDRERSSEWTDKEGHCIQEIGTLGDKVQNIFKLNHLSLSFIFTKKHTEVSIPWLRNMCNSAAFDHCSTPLLCHWFLFSIINISSWKIMCTQSISINGIKNGRRTSCVKMLRHRYYQFICR